MKNDGFTLIEVLVALLIIAIALGSAGRAISTAVNNVKDSYYKQVAGWVANNQVSSIIVNGTFPDLGTTTKQESMAGLDFIETIVVSTTPNKFFRQVEVSVADKDHPNYYLTKSINYISQY